MTLSKYATVVSLLALILLIITCAKDNSITGNSNQSLAKPTDLFGTNSHNSYDKDKIEQEYRDRDNPKCWVEQVIIPHISVHKSYDFRDNYLSKSDKGNKYTKFYYELSKYGIENNLVNKYYKEHFELLKINAEIASDLQYGSNINQILLNKKTSDDLKYILRVYRDSPNYKEIEPILDYLEADLDKYSNKPKYEIAKDFQ